MATQPAVDGTDLFVFRSYEPGREQYVTIVADYIPFQDPPGFPIFYPLDPNAVYEIHITNDGGDPQRVLLVAIQRRRIGDVDVLA